MSTSISFPIDLVKPKAVAQNKDRRPSNATDSTLVPQNKDRRPSNATGSTLFPQTKDRRPSNATDSTLVPTDSTFESYYDVVGTYRLVTKIGSGSFGDVFKGVDVNTGEEVAVKLEPEVGSDFPHLFLESKIYRLLSGEIGVPRMRSFSTEKGFHIWSWTC